jgi:hypothetical protein
VDVEQNSLPVIVGLPDAVLNKDGHNLDVTLKEQM